MTLEIVKAAINDVLSGTCPENGNITTEQLYSLESAKYWIYEQDVEFPDYSLSFNKICDVLGLERAAIVEHLEKKLDKVHTIQAVAKKLHLDEASDVRTVCQAAKEYVESQMRQFGHEVEVKVNLDMTIECSKSHLETLCKSVLGI